MSQPSPKEIRERHTDYLASWKDIREEGRKNMLCVAGDVWEAVDPKGKKAREDSERPIISTDEINQYLNQAVNQVRQNKRGIVVSPKGNGASEKTGELRKDMIRGIEYRSQAQQAYTTAFEGAIQRYAGYFAIGRRYESDEGFDQELYIRRLPNPDAVVIDPNYKSAVAADMEDGFIIDLISKATFKRKYKGAKQTDFTTEDQVNYPMWVQDKTVQVGEYWHIRTRPDTLFLIDDGSEPGLKIKKSEADKLKADISHGSLVFPDGQKFPILKTRKIDNKSCWQTITNGLEELEEIEFGGPWVPIIPVFGKEVFIDEGSGAKRRLVSMVSLARDPMMLYAFYRTCQAEMVGMMPKAQVVGYEGQFQDHEDEWQNVNRLPLPYLQVKALLDATGQAVLPPPTRLAYAPDVQSLELCAEGARRAIQAAMGITPLPTAAQRKNEKSGVALDRIAQQEQVGNFHFTDNLDYALQHAGTILNWHIRSTYDTAGRQIGIRKDDGSHELVTLNQPYKNESGQEVHHQTDVGDHEVTISTGASFDSERDEARDFAGQIVQNIEALPIDPSIKSKFFALIIKLRNLGPIGDAMVKLLDPGEDSPQLVQQQLQKTSMDLKAMHAYAQQVEGELNQLKQEKQAKQVEIQGKAQVSAMELDFKAVQEQVKVLIAEIQTKAQKESERDQLFAEALTQLRQHSHEAALQAAEQQHEKQLADKQAAIASAQSAQDASQNQAAEPSAS
jgi:hypothetical protein